MDHRLCVICEKSCSGCQTLSSGYLYHRECYENLFSEYQNKRAEIQQLKSQVWRYESTLREREGVVYKLKSFFQKDDQSSHEIEQKITEANQDIDHHSHKLIKAQKVLMSLWDYWIETPPDWETRKGEVSARSGNSCEKCGTRTGEKHVHHKIPVSRGGSHRIENLQYLCVSCHSRAHGGRNVSVEWKDGGLEATNRPAFADRLETIQKAIEHKLTIAFSYEKYSGEKSRRSINPSRLEQKGQSLCVSGYCHLRNEERIFAIKRMRGVKIVDSPGRCYDK